MRLLLLFETRKLSSNKRQSVSLTAFETLLMVDAAWLAKEFFMSGKLYFPSLIVCPLSWPRVQCWHLTRALGGGLAVGRLRPALTSAQVIMAGTEQQHVSMVQCVDMGSGFSS